jgi:hypothetical protein
MTGPKSSGFFPQTVRLLECAFRANDDAPVDASGLLVAPKLDLSFTGTVDHGQQLIAVVGDVRGSDPPGKLATIRVHAKVMAVFSWKGEISMSPQEFARHNAPAILWPYLRELIWNISVRMDRPPLVLPVLNFQVADFHLEEVGLQPARTKGREPKVPTAGKRR